MSVGTSAARPPQVVIIDAGMSEHASTSRLAELISEALTEVAEGTLGGHAAGNSPEIPGPALVPAITHIRLRPLAHAIMDAMLTGFPGEDLASALESLGAADGVIALTPTYQGSYSGLFKAFFDCVPEDALEGTPVLVGATGGTPRHAFMTEMAMRPLMVHLHAHVVPTAIYVAAEDWGAHAYDSGGDGGRALMRRARRGARELLEAIAARQLTSGVVAAASASAPKENSTISHQATHAESWPDFADFATLMGRK
ncbi:MAG: NAD(P)H-dependent oxidoreductase [Actinomycetaceae bacterium]|nr:NAD(P)H-dependent oxidoreductase [Actinomycetaceae bacterium]